MKKNRQKQSIRNSNSLGSTSKTYYTLNYEEKKEAYALMMAGSTPKVLTQKYGCGIRQLQFLKANGVPVFDFGNGESQRNRKPLYYEVDLLTLRDCDNHRALGHPLSGPMISGYAKMNADIILKDTTGLYRDDVKAKYVNATFGKSYVDSFKRRHQFRGLKVNGERATVDQVEVERKMAAIRDAIMQNIGPADVFNWDETGLFYRSVPTGTLARKGDDGAGGKLDKLRLTLLLCVNGDGSNKELVSVDW